MPVQYSVIIKMGCGKKIAAAVHIDIIVFYFSKQYNEDKKGVCFYEVSEICRENGLKAGCVACAVRIRSDLPSGKTCRECFFLCHRSTDLIFLVAAFTAFFNLCGCSLVYWLELGWRFMRCCSCLSCSKKSENISKKTYVFLSFHKITNKAACGQSYFLRGW